MPGTQQRSGPARPDLATQNGCRRRAPGWATLTHDPKILPIPGGGPRLVFGGFQDSDSGNFFSAGHLYHAISHDGGASWTTPAEALTRSGYVGATAKLRVKK